VKEGEPILPAPLLYNINLDKRKWMNGETTSSWEKDVLLGRSGGNKREKKRGDETYILSRMQSKPLEIRGARIKGRAPSRHLLRERRIGIVCISRRGEIDGIRKGGDLF